MKNKTTLGGDALRLTVSKILAMCISTVTAMLLARFRTLEEYGTYSQLLLVINLFSAIFMLGLPNSINYFLARAESREEKQHFLSVYYTINTILSLVMGAALVCAIPLIEGFFKNPLIRSFAYFLAIYPWASIISASVENILIVYQRTSFLIYYKLVNSALILGMMLAVQLLGLGFREYMIGSLGVYMAFALSVYVIVAKLSGGLRICVDSSLIKKILVFSIPLGLSSIVGTLNLEMDKLLIGRMMSTEELAVYTNAAKELPLTIVSTSITAVLLPQVAKMVKNRETGNALKLWGEATELSLLFMGLAVAGLFAYAEDIITILYSEKYLAGVPVFRVYALVLLLRITYFGMILNALGRTKEIMHCSIIALLLNVILNPMLYTVLGILGPAIATILSMLVVMLYQLQRTAKFTGFSFGEVFPWYNCGKILAINVLFAAVFYVIKQLLPLDRYVGSIAESILLGIVWSGIYILGMKNKIMSLWHGINNA